MEFRNLKKQYQVLQIEIDEAISKTLQSGNFISGNVVEELEEKLAEYTGCKYCITCANGTDALELALRALNVGAGDAVFVPDFTFFSSGEVVSTVGAMPVFVDVEIDTYNISAESLEQAITEISSQGKYKPKAVIAVDLFGQPAEYDKILKITKEYNMYLIEDGAQGFGGKIGDKPACSFGDISTTSFFPAKPLGCYGDGGAVFTNNASWNKQIRSLCVHGKSTSGKYDNIQIGMNSRLDSIQAAILLVKLEAFQKYEIDAVNKFAKIYTENLKDIVDTPFILENYQSSWAQYTIRLKSSQERWILQRELSKQDIPSMIYYIKPMNKQQAFSDNRCLCGTIDNTNRLCDTVLSLPISPYMTQTECDMVIQNICKIIISHRNN